MVDIRFSHYAQITSLQTFRNRNYNNNYNDNHYDNHNDNKNNDHSYNTSYFFRGMKGLTVRSS